MRQKFLLIVECCRFGHCTFDLVLCSLFLLSLVLLFFFPKDGVYVVEGFCKYSVHVEGKERREEIQGFGRIGDGVGRWLLLWCWLRQRRFLTVSLVGCFRKAIVTTQRYLCDGKRVDLFSRARGDRGEVRRLMALREALRPGMDRVAGLG